MTIHQWGPDGSLDHCPEAIPKRAPAGQLAHFGICPHATSRGTFPLVNVRPVIRRYHL